MLETLTPVSGPGLSPRVRGNRPGVAVGLGVAGSIPACAGEPPAIRISAISGGVYPRVCGGTPVTVPSAVSCPGLSPRVRGNQEYLLFKTYPRGSIPACAGEPPSATSSVTMPQVYPRVCGGTGDFYQSGPREGGLSPRVRGNQLPAAGLPPSSGSIPACAGEPTRTQPQPTSSRVYPRVCGGTTPRWRGVWESLGLSPRVRGNPLPEWTGQGMRRSIPACAGEPLAGICGIAWRGVYPRVCGGTTGRRRFSSRRKGLSPRVRGNPPPSRKGVSPMRSIPACAGEPRPNRERHPCREVYPRVCGGTVQGRLLSTLCTGLSPRVRGNHPPAVRRRNCVGSIPACAGEPVREWNCAGRSGVYPRVCGGTYRGCLPHKRR